MKRLSSALINAALVCCALAIGAAVTELALRVVGLSPPVKLGWMGMPHGHNITDLTEDSQTGYKMWPNRGFVWSTESRDHTYHANSAGFRSDHEFDPADSRYRIALIGDSYTWGSGVENRETFSALLESDSENVVTWNFGMPGFGIDQIWLSGRYKALPLHPDLLIMGVINADFERSQATFREGFDKPTFRVVNGRLVQRPTEAPPNFFARYLDQYSHLWGAWQRSKRWVGTNYGFTEYWTLNQAILDALREDCRTAGVPLLFVYVPISSFKGFPALSDYMRRTDANYIDLTSQQPRPPRSIYLKYDGHLSVEGHRYVANLIERWIKAHPEISVRQRQ